jgi:leucyl-tRNA synthetase
MKGYEYGIMPNGDMQVTCWCERVSVVVSNEDVRNGITKSCGKLRCDRIAFDKTGVKSKRSFL